MTAFPGRVTATEVPQHAALRVEIVMTAAQREDAGVRRLLHRLTGDPRFALCGVREVAGTAVAGVADRMIGLERRLVPPPRRGQVPPVPDLAGMSVLAPDRSGLGGQGPGVDVVVDLCSGADVLAGTHPARFGTWTLDSYSAGGRIAPAVAGAPVTPVRLTRTLDGGERRLVAQTGYDTKILASHNAEYAREKSVQLLLRELARVQSGSPPADLGPAPGADVVGLADLPGYAWRGVRAAGERVAHRIMRKTGRVGGRFGLCLGRGDVLTFDPNGSSVVPLPTGHFYADPFLLSHEGEVWCFFEDFDYARGLGHISAGRVVNGSLAEVRPVMKPAHHLSFPFVFHWRGEVLMIPEAHQVGRLEIWRARRFPDDWELFSAGPEGMPMVDSVLLERDGEWWLFTHVPVDSFGDFCNELHVFRVDGPELKRIEPHPLNPVVIGAATARGGGRVHRVGHRLIRMSQDNSGGVYGYGLNVMEITRLDETGYEERRIRHLTPGFRPGLVGTHHLDAAGGWFVMDVRWR